MAFGFGFNKQKVLSAAEKFVQQGKLQNAISEYEKVLKADPKDLTVMNTVGDLYSRMGDSQKAVECFKSVGDAYAAQGFTVKAIAMYKKLSKSKASLESALRLAELYTQQGLFNDARAQYLQVAEEFLRAGELEQAVRIFQKTLEMDPENVAMRTRLADVYVRLGKKAEAFQIFASAVETLRKKGQFEAAQGILQRMMTLDPANREAFLLRGQNAVDSGDYPGAIENLEKVSGLEANHDGLSGLFRAYLQTARWSDAGILAKKLLSLHNDVAAVRSYAAALLSAAQYEEALAVYREHADRLLASDPASLLESLHSIIGHVRQNPQALEDLLDLFKQAGESTHFTEIYELLGHAYVQSGNFAKARDYYFKLTQLEPQNQLHTNNYQQVLAKLGSPSGSGLITSEEGAALVEELETLAPLLDQRLDDKVALAVRAALTDAELFISYNMPAKALGPLLAALPAAPRDLRLNQRLVTLFTRAGNFGEAALCCRTLESIYHDAGHPEEAARYGDIAGRYEERASSAASAVDSAAAALPTASPASREFEVHTPPAPAETPAPWPTEAAEASLAPEGPGLFFHAPIAPPAASSAIPASSAISAEPREAAKPLVSDSEIDLSSEWDGAIEEQDSEAPAVASRARSRGDSGNPEVIQETVAEIRFYLSQSMREEAHAALETLKELAPPPSLLAQISDEVKNVALRTRQPLDEISLEESSVPASALEPDSIFDVPAATEALAAGHSAPQASPASLDDFVSDLESSLGQQFSLPTPEPQKAAAIASSEPAKAAQDQFAKPVAMKAASPLGDLADQLDQSLGADFPSAPPLAQPPAAMAAAAPSSSTSYPHMAARAPQPAPLAAVPAAEQVAGVDLADMFGELKTELEQDATLEDADPETHYSLGVAFREMGLLDEAIGELQKVCQAVDGGHPFAQIMQTYTWLAQCFLDKGVPEAAIRWYDQALKLPTIDQQTRMALHYELASAHEIAGDKTSALSNFMQVYGSNIDYRDVAERIRALKS
jgi:tetratricopeptide (TPR) repeat protein